MRTGEGAMMHWHNFPQIWYVFRGELLHTVGKETCRAKEGTCIFVPAFCPHGTTEATADAEVISVSFTEEMLANAKDVFLLGDEPYVFGRRVEIFSHFEGEAKREFGEIVSSLKTECEKPRGGSVSKLSTLLLRIFKRICSKKAAKKLTPAQRRRINEITEVVAYIAEDIAEKITIESFCKVLNVSQAAFMRNFKKVTGMTFAKMLLSMRVRYACLQLARTEKKMIAIAGEAGFYDEAHFTHSFSESMGETPTQYRLNNKTIFDDICIVCEEGPREIELTSKRAKKRKKTTLKNG
jgi:AraC-like DNA-binding protein